LKKSDQITKNAAYEAVAPDDFASMIEVDRYGQRSSDFDKIISDTHAHFWDPLDTKYIDFSENFDVENKLLMPEEFLPELQCPSVMKLDKKSKIKLANESFRWQMSAILHEHGLHLCHGARGRGLHSVMLAAHDKEGRHQIIGSLRKVAQVPTSFTRHFNPENFTPNKIAERITHARHGHTHTTYEQYSQVSSDTTNAEPDAFRTASANQSTATNFGRGLGSRLSAGILPELGAAISSNPSSAGFSLTVHPNMTREQKIKAVQDFMMNVSRDRQQALTLQPKF